MDTKHENGSSWNLGAQEKRTTLLLIREDKTIKETTTGKARKRKFSNHRTPSPSRPYLLDLLLQSKYHHLQCLQQNPTCNWVVNRGGNFMKKRHSEKM
ncbi:hypothetical protein CHS0354_012401 [Potamilus streckersoni]|uniref:Uncharacterized protein n=1 Tax=Potamilus streckersoni TaxID=2493646 RepID=A0AAE0RZ23_9BIVA|nr:hypothetical protein CHS0354_012401 [Potamilus streckersoni]